LSNTVEQKLARLDQYLNGLKAKLTVRLAILFGSLVRGDWTQSSDIDILLVADELSRDPGENYARLKSYGVEPFAFNTEEFVRQVARPNPLALDALQYGLVVTADEEYRKKVFMAFDETKKRLHLRWVNGRWVWGR